MKKVYYHQKKPKRSKKRQYKEHGHRVAIFQWAKLYERQYPELTLLNGSLEGVDLNPRQAKRAKDSGVKSGFPDINLPVARGGYLGLYIESKTDKGKLSDNQKRVMNMLTIAGHLVLAIKGSAKSIEIIERYLKNEIRKPVPLPAAEKGELIIHAEGRSAEAEVL